MGQGLMGRLKVATREQHEAVERQVDLDELCASRQAYVAHLCALWGVQAPLEARLLRLEWSRVGLDFESRRRAALLRADIEALAPAVEVDALAVCGALPPVDTLPRGLGCLYVLEGSRLGGQIIARAIGERGGAGVDGGCRFMASDGVKLGPLWKEFKAAVDRVGRDHPEQAAPIVASAKATFESVYAWLEAAESVPALDTLSGEAST